MLAYQLGPEARRDILPNGPPSYVEMLLRSLSRRRPAPAHAAWLACALMTLAGVGDWLTGADAAFTLFYVLPLALAVWFVNLRMGYVVVVFSVLVGTACDVFRSEVHHSWYFIAWNSFMEAALYLLLAQLFAAVRERVAREVRQRIEAFDQLRQSERLSSTGKLAAGIAQEINDHLDAICERASRMRDLSTQDVDACCASEICVQVERIRGVVSLLLNFSRHASAGTARGDLKTLVDETLAILKPIADRGGVTIVRSGGSVEARFNSAEIQQVVTNLVSNAIDAMPAGGKIEVATDVAYAAAPGKPRAEPEPVARIAVRDHGVGISPDALPCIFDPFAIQANSGAGVRLGLAVSYQIVEEHGGWITVDTRLGEGTSFLVHLPC